MIANSVASASTAPKLSDRLIVSPARTSATERSALVTVIPGPGNGARLGLFFVDRESSPGVWEVAGTVLITKTLGLSPRREQILNPKRVKTIYEVSPKSLIVRIYLPAVVPGRNLRLRGNSDVVSNTFTAEKTAALVVGRPRALGAHCQDTDSAALQSAINRWDDANARWTGLPQDPARTCDNLAPGLYRVLTKSGDLDRYLTVG